AACAPQPAQRPVERDVTPTLAHLQEGHRGDADDEGEHAGGQETVTGAQPGPVLDPVPVLAEDTALAVLTCGEPDPAGESCDALWSSELEEIGHHLERTRRGRLVAQRHLDGV